MNEQTHSLVLFRIEILRKTNLQAGNEEIEVKASISVVIISTTTTKDNKRATTKDSAEIRSFPFRSVHLIYS